MRTKRCHISALSTAVVGWWKQKGGLCGACEIVLVVGLLMMAMATGPASADPPNCAGLRVVGPYTNWNVTWDPSGTLITVCRSDTNSASLTCNVTDEDWYGDPGPCTDTSQSYVWDPSVSNANSYSFDHSATGTYSFTCTVTDATGSGCDGNPNANPPTNEQSHTWTVDVIGIDTLTADGTVVNIGDTVTFTATGYFGSQLQSPPSWTGATLSQNTSTTSTATREFTAAGIFTISVSLSGCTSETKSVVVVVQNPDDPDRCPAEGGGGDSGGCT